MAQKGIEKRIKTETENLVAVLEGKANIEGAEATAAAQYQDENTQLAGQAKASTKTGVEAAIAGRYEDENTTVKGRAKASTASGAEAEIDAQYKDEKTTIMGKGKTSTPKGWYCWSHALATNVNWILCC